MKRQWRIDGLTYTEACRQPYPNCYFAAGFVDGHEVDTMYFQLHKDGTDEIFVIMRPDEIAALVWVLSGALFSLHIGPKEADGGRDAV